MSSVRTASRGGAKRPSASSESGGAGGGAAAQPATSAAATTRSGARRMASPGGGPPPRHAITSQTRTPCSGILRRRVDSRGAAMRVDRDGDAERGIDVLEEAALLGQDEATFPRDSEVGAPGRVRLQARAIAFVGS